MSPKMPRGLASQLGQILLSQMSNMKGRGGEEDPSVLGNLQIFGNATRQRLPSQTDQLSRVVCSAQPSYLQAPLGGEAVVSSDPMDTINNAQLRLGNFPRHCSLFICIPHYC